jgi:hypothetical protein
MHPILREAVGRKIAIPGHSGKSMRPYLKNN